MKRVSRPASPAAAVQEHEAYAVLTSGPGSCGESWRTSLAGNGAVGGGGLGAGNAACVR
jgi:hypothetical protein